MFSVDARVSPMQMVHIQTELWIWIWISNLQTPKLDIPPMGLCTRRIALQRNYATSEWIGQQSVRNLILPLCTE